MGRVSRWKQKEKPSKDTRRGATREVVNKQENVVCPKPSNKRVNTATKLKRITMEKRTLDFMIRK